MVSAIFTLVIAARKKASENAETGKTDKNSENNKNRDEDLRINLAWVPYIQYPIIF